jgi:hypothetical protein
LADASEMKTNFHFTVQYYFPARIILVLAGIPIGIGLFATQYFLWAGIILVGCIVVWTTHYGFEIDFSSKKYREYAWILGIKTGEPIRFDRIEYLFVKKITMSQTMHSKITTASFSSEEYRGFIKFNEDDKIHFITGKNRETLIEKIKPTAKQMGVALFDYSDSSRVQIL